MRNGTIDAMRGVGALAIIWFHLGLAGSSVALSALPMFVTLLIYFGARHSLRSHGLRLLGPWLIWCAVYGAFKMADAVASGLPPASEFSLWMLWTGPAIHLWFLPFCFLYLATFGRLPGWVIGRIAIPLAVATLALGSAVTLPPPLAQWCSVLGAALLGQAMATAQRPHAWAMLFAAIGCMLYVAGAETGSLQLAISSVAVVIALSFPTKTGGMTQWASQMSLGVYLAHPLLNAVVLRLHGFSVADRYLAVVALSVLCTLALGKLWPAAVGGSGAPIWAGLARPRLPTTTRPTQTLPRSAGLME